MWGGGDVGRGDIERVTRNWEGHQDEPVLEGDSPLPVCQLV